MDDQATKAATDAATASAPILTRQDHDGVVTLCMPQENDHFAVLPVRTELQ